MKLRTKITLLSSILVMTILLFVDVTVHLLFVKIATRNEREISGLKSFLKPVPK